mgnify:CR=1 FL=1
MKAQTGYVTLKKALVEGRPTMEHLVHRIIRDNTCVIEGSESELQECWRLVSNWRMQEECKERKLDYDWIRKLNDADFAIAQRIDELKAIDSATD